MLPGEIMTTHHAVIWLDHAEAHIIHFTVNTAEKEVVKTHSTHPHLHVLSGNVGSGRVPVNGRYFEDIINSLHDSIEILLMGPGNEKDEFMKYVKLHHKPVAEKIVATLTDDHPTDLQLLAFARKYFVKLDKINMNPVNGLKHP
jgi:stalled ribosome rescue protein Dom34